MNIRSLAVVAAVLIAMISATSRLAQAYPGLMAYDISISEEVWEKTNDQVGAALDKEGLDDGRIVQKDGRDFFSARLRFVGGVDEPVTAVYCYSLQAQKNNGEVVGFVIELERLASLYLLKEGKIEIRFKDESAPCLRQDAKQKEKQKNERYI